MVQALVRRLLLVCLRFFLLLWWLLLLLREVRDRADVGTGRSIEFDNHCEGGIGRFLLRCGDECLGLLIVFENDSFFLWLLPFDRQRFFEFAGC